MQVLQADWDGTFSEASFGFRPKRSAHQAVERAQAYIASGHAVVVDIDLEKFFDRVNHDILMGLIAKRVADKRILKLIRAFLNAGVMEGGLVSPTEEGTPQGGPLSPLLSNLMLDVLDKELEKRGHRFVRYADDCNVYVRSQKAGQRVMALLKRLYDKLHLKINESKSAVASAFGRKFLGYSLWAAPKGEVKRAVSMKALETFKQRIRQLTSRSGGRSMTELVEPLRRYMLGWKAYFGLAQTPRIWRELDEWLRHRLRAIQLKQWRRGTTIYRELLALGASPSVARRVAANSRRWWRNSRMALNNVLTIAYFDRLGVPRLS
jgi:RNA-directed DNA polymerase